MSSDEPLASLSLTHVHYDPRDPLSYVSAWLALLPQGLCIVYVTLIWSTREIEIALTFGGQLCCEALNWGLKRWIKEERPQTIKALGKGYGMPSSHAQFVAYFAVYVGLFLMLRHSPSSKRWVGSPRTEVVHSPNSSGNGQLVGVLRHRRESSETMFNSPNDSPRSPTTSQGPYSVDINGQESTLASNGEDVLAPDPDVSPAYALQLHYPRLTHSLLTCGMVALACVVSASRIYLSYHTPKQVYVGSMIGSAFAVFWFGLTEVVRRTGWVEWLLEWTLVRRARIRDLLCEEDLVELGWQIWEEKRRRRHGRARRKSVRFEKVPEKIKPVHQGGKKKKKG